MSFRDFKTILFVISIFAVIWLGPVFLIAYLQRTVPLGLENVKTKENYCITNGYTPFYIHNDSHDVVNVKCKDKFGNLIISVTTDGR